VISISRLGAILILAAAASACGKRPIEEGDPRFAEDLKFAAQLRTK
jgi:hypothetical protein